MGEKDKPVKPVEPPTPEDKDKKEKEKAERVKKIKEAKDFIDKTKPKMVVTSGNKTYKVDFKIIVTSLYGL